MQAKVTVDRFPSFKANFLLNDFTGILHKHNRTLEDCGISPIVFHFIVQCMYHGKISRALARETIELMVADK